jgi:hypothetical protein
MYTGARFHRRFRSAHWDTCLRAIGDLLYYTSTAGGGIFNPWQGILLFFFNFNE